MRKGRYERTNTINPKLPFIFHKDVLITSRLYTHWHDSIEFLYCFKGEGITISNSKEIPMSKGDLIVINSRHIHAIITNHNVSYHCLIVSNNFFEENGFDIKNIAFDEKINDSQANKLFTVIKNIQDDKSSQLYIPSIRSSLLNFCLYMVKNYSKILDDSDKTISKKHTLLLDTLEYINKNCSQKLTLEYLANRVGYSKYHFARLFKEATGFTVVNAINAARCEKAKKLLTETSMSVSEICEECGFDYCSYFSKTFKLQYGCIPSEYRKNYSKLTETN